jgi:ribA/ribD-fused uncharacterized protein
MDWQDEEGTVHANCAVFYKVDEEFGGLSNMAGSYPLRVAGAVVGSSKALYQACRFPRRPDWQQEIISQASPMAAKMKTRKERRRDQSRPDWGQIDVEVMRWVLRVKLAQHFDRLAPLLERTAGRAIVEKSRKDRTWGAVEDTDGRLHGRNQLGLLLMELRARLRESINPAARPPFVGAGLQPARPAQVSKSQREVGP